jgi:hypothetical protein
MNLLNNLEEGNKMELCGEGNKERETKTRLKTRKGKERVVL